MEPVFRWVKQNKWIVIGVLAALGVAFYYGYRGDGDSTDTGSSMETAKATKGDLSVTVTGSGQVAAASQVDIRPQVAGDGLDIVRVAVRNDQEVRKGDLIAVLDNSEAQRSVRNAELSLRNDQIRMDQTEELYDSRTEEDRQARQLQEIAVSQSAISLENAREKLEEYSIRAPFDGIVTGLSAEAGDSVARTETLASVITRELVAVVSLNEVDAAHVTVGDPATLTFDALDGVTLRGEVSKIDTIGTVSQNVVYYEAEISLPDAPGNLKPGMSVSASIETDSKRDVLIVPSSAVKSDGSGEYVIVPSGTGDEAATSRQAVKTGLSDGVVTEILSGLSTGDTVVTRMPTASSASASSTQSQGLLQSVVRTPGSGGGR